MPWAHQTQAPDISFIIIMQHRVTHRVLWHDGQVVEVMAQGQRGRWCLCAGQSHQESQHAQVFLFGALWQQKIKVSKTKCSCSLLWDFVPFQNVLRLWQQMTWHLGRQQPQQQTEQASRHWSNNQHVGIATCQIQRFREWGVVFRLEHS